MIGQSLYNPLRDLWAKVFEGMESVVIGNTSAKFHSIVTRHTLSNNVGALS